MTFDAAVGRRGAIRTGIGLLQLATLLVLCPGPTAAQEPLDLEALLRGRVEALRSGLTVAPGDRPLLARAALPAFYEGRAFAPVWTATGDADGRVQALIDAIGESRAHGLDPEDYHLAALRTLAGVVGRPGATAAELADLELVASDAFLVLASHLLMGRVNPETIDPEWLANRRDAALHPVLEEAATSGDVSGALYALAPQQPRYGALISKLAELWAVDEAGGWPTVGDGPRLETGVSGPRVAQLRRRLAASGDLVDDAEYPDVFDEELDSAVRRFQARHGLDADGVVGPATVRALDVPARERARQVEINLERWRWLPADLGARHVEVNIAGFDVRVVEDGRVVRRHRAVVGRQYRQTPMFSGLMTYLVLAPYWHVPPTIAAVDKLPVIKADPGAIAAQRMTLLEQGTGRPVDPATVDWASMTGAEFNRRYRLRQDPGPSNALGNVKFMFPNRHNVYLHDTPTRELFARASRSFSSGCIRVENPMELTEYLLADQPDWSRSRIDAVVQGGVERSVRLTRPVPVHLLYWTAWSDEEGVVHFRDDIYGRDGTVRAALAADPPGA